jgi:diguanylate cyclase (GGDEF)-like protein
MFFDQFSLLAAIGVSAAALCVTLFGAWFGSRRDTFMLSWALGLAFIVVGIVLFSAVGQRYDPAIQMTSFAALLAGFGSVYAGAMQFRSGQADWTRVVTITALGIVSSAAAFALGFSGVGTTLANFGIAVLLVLTGWQYWKGRSESPLVMTANAALYILTAASFFLCGMVLVLNGQTTLTEQPSNWAEELNAILVIVGLTGIGALSLAMNQSRIARFHRTEALTDPLTGLLNRRALSNRYASSMVRAHTAAILLDLDHFKSINDRYGHAAGDLVLRRFAEIISANTRVSDTAARVGGEEFCIVLHGASQAMATEIAERIRKALEAESIASPNGDIPITVSAGVAICIGEGQNFDTLLERADYALYNAKAEGRNRVKSTGIRLVA